MNKALSYRNIVAAMAGRWGNYAFEASAIDRTGFVIAILTYLVRYVHD